LKSIIDIYKNNQDAIVAQAANIELEGDEVEAQL
jgi:hypothetical protein